MPSAPVVNRSLVGIIAIVCAISGGVMLLFVETSASALGASLLRVAVLMGAWWLALPWRGGGSRGMRMSPWAFAGLLAVLLIVVRRPGAIVPAVILILVTAIVLRPWRR